MRKKTYYIYILSNSSKMIYVGMTNDLARRVYEHKYKLYEGYTNRYNITQLVYFEDTDDVGRAIEREKQIKRWRREKKVFLIEQLNPEWKDLAEKWFV